MLDELHVKDLALVRDATLLPATGLTVITGETGAGKSALVGALALLAGGRADAGAVREGADALQVEGRFLFETANDGLQGSAAEEGVAADAAGERGGTLDAAGVPGGAADAVRKRGSSTIAADAEASPGLADPIPQEAVVCRQVTADGRSRVQVNGSLSSVGQLAIGVGASLDLCGQHEHQRLMQVSNHREMIDAWAFDELLPSLEAYAAAFVAAEDATRAVEEIRSAGALSAEAVEAARFTIARIDEVDPQPDEYDQLRATLSRVENAEALAQQVGGASEALSGDGGAIESMGMATHALDEAARTDPALAEAADALREASYIVEDVARSVRSYRDSIEYDAADLASMQDRMSQLQGILRSYGPTMEAVLEARDRAHATVAAVDEFDQQLSRALAAQEAAESLLAKTAETLHEARTRVAPRFAGEVTSQMQRLELSGAAVECQVDMLQRSAWTLTGPDRVEFLFRPAAGMGARPLVRIASGGEISRVMLAIKVVLGAADDVDTLVFDEVDAGVGGSAARALADVLADLARTHQVIVITHLPQVAVLGDVHYVVRKTADDVPETIVEDVRGQARVAEVARMLSGDTGGVSRAHAAQMLEKAHNLRAK